MKQFWQKLPIATRIFALILLFLAIVEVIATLFVWQFESDVLLTQEKENLTRELSAYKERLTTHLSALQKETDFLAKLEVMDDIIAKDIDKRILRLLERKTEDLGEDILMVITDLYDNIIISPKGFLHLPIHAFKSQYLFFHAPVYASFDNNKKLGTLFLLYPLSNLANLHTDNPDKLLWLQPPKPLTNFPVPKPKNSITVSENVTHFLPGWRLYLAYRKEQALATLQNIEKVQLYTFLLSTLLLGVIIFILSQKMTLPLIELLKSSEESLEAKRTFLSTISHELRTPLGSILNLTQHLTLSSKTDDESQKMLNAIETSAQHLLSMINNILQLSKLEAKSIAVQKEQIDLHEVTEEIFEIIEPLVLDKEIAFHKEISLKNPLITTDSNLLKQVMINLLSNAVKFTQSGEIRVSLRESQRAYIFTVTDTGIGIDPKRQKQLFTPFFQAHIDIEQMKESSGLGLALSQKVAQLLGGKITLYSKGVNQGTKAIFHFKSI